jgi:hypothetical protein
MANVRQPPTELCCASYLQRFQAENFNSHEIV